MRISDVQVKVTALHNEIIVCTEQKNRPGVALQRKVVTEEAYAAVVTHSKVLATRGQEMTVIEGDKSYRVIIKLEEINHTDGCHTEELSNGE